MKRVQCWQSLDGQVHTSKERCLASDLHFRLPKSSSNENAKILEWVDCLRIIEQKELIESIFIQLDENEAA